ncbi:MAG: hypothetical protein IJC94_07345, partial [Oscillospiraceae bacterium]|nr:hypothetical protein [Oscillospiraceae bacterium]
FEQIMSMSRKLQYQMLAANGAEGRLPFIGVDDLETKKARVVFQGAEGAYKGNHDYWWTTKSKMDRFFAENELTTLNILHNNAVRVGDVCVCGTRGWMLEDGKPADKKVTLREAGRLEASIKAADELGGEKVAVLHYPPIFANDESEEIIEIIKKHGIRRCYYGHLHSDACRFAFNAERYGTRFTLISADFVKFRPLLIE